MTPAIDRSSADSDRSRRTHELFVEVASGDGRESCLRAEIIRINMCVAEAIAHRYRNRGENDEDLQQVAYLGLTKAVARFDPDLGNDFLTFAVPTITGEIKRHFRDQCWVVRPPRRIQELQGRIFDATDRLRQQLGRTPLPDDVAHCLGVDVREVREALSANGCFAPTSLDSPVYGQETSVLSDLIVADESAYDRSEAIVILAPLVGALPQREREVLGLRFFRQWTQDQIAQHLGTTQMHVSRTLSRTFRRLRAQAG